MTVHLIDNLGASLVVARDKKSGRTLVLIDKGESRRRILGLTRLLLHDDERRELYRILKRQM
jgi:hypothetical protein